MVRAGPAAPALPERRLNELHLGALLMIDRPSGFTGHGAGGTYGFSRRYGACLLRFVLDQPSACPR